MLNFIDIPLLIKKQPPGLAARLSQAVAVLPRNERDRHRFVKSGPVSNWLQSTTDTRQKLHWQSVTVHPSFLSLDV